MGEETKSSISLALTCSDRSYLDSRFLDEHEFLQNVTLHDCWLLEDNVEQLAIVSF
jgi:hypothetical protein